MGELSIFQDACVRVTMHINSTISRTVNEFRAFPTDIANIISDYTHMTIIKSVCPENILQNKLKITMLDAMSRFLCQYCMGQTRHIHIMVRFNLMSENYDSIPADTTISYVDMLNMLIERKCITSWVHVNLSDKFITSAANHLGISKIHVYADVIDLLNQQIEAIIWSG